jgi:hypothetical protein
LIPFKITNFGYFLPIEAARFLASYNLEFFDRRDLATVYGAGNNIYLGFYDGDKLYYLGNPGERVSPQMINFIFVNKLCKCLHQEDINCNYFR